MKNGEEKQGNNKLCRIKLMLQGRIDSCRNSEGSNSEDKGRVKRWKRFHKEEFQPILKSRILSVEWCW